MKSVNVDTVGGNDARLSGTHRAQPVIYNDPANGETLRIERWRRRGHRWIAARHCRGRRIRYGATDRQGL